MRKVVFACCLAVLCAGAVRANELANGGFERELGERDWFKTWGNFSVESWNNPPEGTKAGYIKGSWSGMDYGGIVQVQPATEGFTYELSAKFYVENGWMAEQSAMKIEFCDGDANRIDYKEVPLKTLLDRKWITRRILAKAPKGTRSVQVVIEASGINDKGVLGIDDVVLRK